MNKKIVIAEKTAVLRQSDREVTKNKIESLFFLS